MIVPLSVTSASGKKVAVLSPAEKNLIWDKLSPVYRMRGDFLLYTSMRISESIYVSKHPECFRKDNAAIFLPIVPNKGKARCLMKQRVVTLTTNGVNAAEEFFKHKVGFASYQNMEAAFILAAEKAGFDASFITTKMLRKTGVSWHLAAYPNQTLQISRMAGHDLNTMTKHYLADGWRKEDRKDIIAELAGWGEI